MQSLIRVQHWILWDKFQLFWGWSEEKMEAVTQRSNQWAVSLESLQSKVSQDTDRGSLERWLRNYNMISKSQSSAYFIIFLSYSFLKCHLMSNYVVYVEMYMKRSLIVTHEYIFNTISSLLLIFMVHKWLQKYSDKIVFKWMEVRKLRKKNATCSPHGFKDSWAI